MEPTISLPGDFWSSSSLFENYGLVASNTKILLATQDLHVRPSVADLFPSLLCSPLLHALITWAMWPRSVVPVHGPGILLCFLARNSSLMPLDLPVAGTVWLALLRFTLKATPFAHAAFLVYCDMILAQLECELRRC
jgi:hypothetical protein